VHDSQTAKIPGMDNPSDMGPSLGENSSPYRQPWLTLQPARLSDNEEAHCALRNLRFVEWFTPMDRRETP